MVVVTANNLLAIGYIRMELPSIFYTHVNISYVSIKVHDCPSDLARPAVQVFIMAGIKFLSENRIFNSC